MKAQEKKELVKELYGEVLNFLRDRSSELANELEIEFGDEDDYAKKLYDVEREVIVKMLEKEYKEEESFGCR